MKALKFVKKGFHGMMGSLLYSAAKDNGLSFLTYDAEPARPLKSAGGDRDGGERVSRSAAPWTSARVKLKLTPRLLLWRLLEAQAAHPKLREGG
jgi:hypothetical protein